MEKKSANGSTLTNVQMVTCSSMHAGTATASQAKGAPSSIDVQRAYTPYSTLNSRGSLYITQQIFHVTHSYSRHFTTEWTSDTQDFVVPRLLKIFHLRQCTHIYSGASHNGPSQKRPPTLQRTNTKAPIDFSIYLM